jgi:ribosomal protein S18 acetylase RimI-like enzyme
MPYENRPAPLPRTFLTSEERGAIQRLAGLCSAYEGLDLKLALEPPPDASLEKPGAFLYYADDGDLVGFCSLDGSHEVEVCGMVHPHHRRHGIGTELLIAAQRACKARGAGRILLICEDASQSGRAFAAAHRGQRCFGEYRMVLVNPTILHDIALHDDRLALRQVAANDQAAVGTFVWVRASVFGEELDDARQRVSEGLPSTNEHYYNAFLDGEPVGCLKLAYEGAAVGIYAFGVLPERRRQGVGKRVLACAVAIAEDQSRQRIWLEVEEENVPALALYHSCGFQETTIYGYFELPLMENGTEV